jgi:hypothetical protein
MFVIDSMTTTYLLCVVLVMPCTRRFLLHADGNSDMHHHMGTNRRAETVIVAGSLMGGHLLNVSRREGW